jgi:hypothetical protein
MHYISAKSRQILYKADFGTKCDMGNPCFSTGVYVENVDNFSPKKLEKQVILMVFLFSGYVFHILRYSSEFSTPKEEKVYFSVITL